MSDLPICSITLTLPSSGHGVMVGISTPEGGEVQRIATPTDQRAMVMELLHLLQAQMTVQVMLQTQQAMEQKKRQSLTIPGVRMGGNGR